MFHYLIGLRRADGQLWYVHVNPRNNVPELTETPYKSVMYTDVFQANSMLRVFTDDNKVRNIKDGEKLIIIRATFEELDMEHKSIEELQQEDIVEQTKRIM